MAVGAAGTFDDQASRYDLRAGLPTDVGALVARTIVERARLGPGDLVVELGAGTGDIGAHFARLPIRYVGLDASGPMLRQFRAKVVDGTPALVLADCDRAWPLRDGAAAAIVASRVVHLLDPDHVAQETLRVGRRAGFLILGRVRRERDSVKERLRRRRQELLAEAGVASRHGDAGTRLVVESCVAAGGESLGRWEAAEWSGETTPAAVIAGWASLSRIGSVPVDAATRAGIVDAVQRWALAEIGELDRPEAFRECYVIDVVRLPAR